MERKDFLWLIGFLLIGILTCFLPDPAGAQTLGNGFKLRYQEMRRDGSNAATTVALPGSLTVAGNASVTGGLGLRSGSSTAPSMAFSAFPTTGIYDGGNVPCITISGVLSAYLNASELVVKAAIAAANGAVGAGRILNAVATANAPAFSFSGNTNTGLGRNAVGEPSMIASGVEAMRWTSTGTIALQPVIIATNTPVTGYALTVGATVATGGAYIMGAVNCESVIDHTPAPATLADAYEIIQSHEAKDGKLDHSKLSPLAWGTRTVTRKTGRKIAKTEQIEVPIPAEEIPATEEGKPEPATTRTVSRDVEVDETEHVTEPDQSGRSLSMTVSALAMTVADLTAKNADLLRRLEAIELKDKH